MPGGLLQRLLTRSGILPFLRGQWRDDQASSTGKLEKRLDKQLASLKEQVDRLSALAEQMQRLEPLADAADRIGAVDREVRVLRATLALNIARRATSICESFRFCLALSFCVKKTRGGMPSISAPSTT